MNVKQWAGLLGVGIVLYACGGADDGDNAAMPPRASDELCLALADESGEHLLTMAMDGDETAAAVNALLDDLEAGHSSLVPEALTDLAGTIMERCPDVEDQYLELLANTATAEPGTNAVTVMVARQHLVAGTDLESALTAGQLELRSVPSALVADDALMNEGAVKGRSLATDVRTGQVLTERVVDGP